MGLLCTNHEPTGQDILRLLMKCATKKLQRFAIGILAILSLCVSAVAACACDHHNSEPRPERSCHGTTASGHHEKTVAKQNSFIGETCVCLPSATKLSVKTEGFKLKKSPAATAVDPQGESPAFFSSAPPVRDNSAIVFRIDSRSESPPARGPPLT